jgi:methylamine dehydrogenase accessory protein MauD
MSQALLMSNIVLWLLAGLLGATLLLAARRVGALLAQLPPAGALMIDRGPAVGTAAPRFVVSDLKGHAVVIGAATDGLCMLLLFISSTCPVCRKLLPLVGSLARDEADWLRIVLVGDGEPEAEAARMRRYALREVPFVLSEAVGRGFRIGRLPYAVLIDQDGFVRAKGLVNSRQHLESLFEAKERGVASLQEFLRRRRGDSAGAEPQTPATPPA